MRPVGPSDVAIAEWRGSAATLTTLTNEALGSSGALGIAPVEATVHWSIIGGQEGMTLLEGFSIGDENSGFGASAFTIAVSVYTISVIENAGRTASWIAKP